MTDRNERNIYGALTDWALAWAALDDYGCDCGEDEPGTCLACRCERAMKMERKRAESAEAERDALLTVMRCGPTDDSQAITSQREIVQRLLERRQIDWHPIPPATALSGHELCVLTQAGSVREATDAEILAHPVVAALVARKFDRPEEP